MNTPVNTPLIDKTRLADAFSKAAPSYDQAARLQREVGRTLLAQLPVSAPARLLDLGCGTGYFTAQLGQRYPQAAITGLDIAPGMLAFARQLLPDLPIQWLCADAEQLPLNQHSYGLIFSSLAIQWCENLPALWAGIAHTLEQGAAAHIATLGPQTLRELRSAWAQVDHYRHVNQFASLASIQASLPAHLQLEQVKRELKVLPYTSLRQLTQELKSLGAYNINADRAAGLTTPAKLRLLQQAYECYRQPDGTLPASYEVLYLTLRKTSCLATPTL